jgi:sortase (surface protein transpeptidase)
MLPIPLPWLIVGVLVSLFGTYRVGHHYGWIERDNDMKLAIAKKNEESRKKEQELGDKLQDQETKLRKAQDEVKKKQSAMHELARTGRLRLPAIEALIDIAADGDKAITKLNACVAAYNEVRSLLNGQQ